MAWAVDILDGPELEDHHDGIMTAGHCFHQGERPEETVFSFDTRDDDVEATGVEYHVGDSGDYGYLQLDDGDAGSPLVELEFEFKFVKEIGDPVEGTVVCKFGVSTDETCGEVERVDVSNVFDFGDGNVLIRGLTRASYCSLHGDSGAPVYTSYTGFGATDSSITALGVHSGSLSYPRVVSDSSDTEDNVEWVCGEEVGEPNEAFFTPLSNIDIEDRFFVKISGG